MMTEIFMLIIQCQSKIYQLTVTRETYKKNFPRFMHFSFRYRMLGDVGQLPKSAYMMSDFCILIIQCFWLFNLAHCSTIPKLKKSFVMLENFIYPPKNNNKLIKEIT